MVSNYIKSTTRNILRYRFFSFINIFGLAISMAVCMAIMMLVADQMMHDRFNTRRHRIYRINTVPIGKNGEEGDEMATTSLPLRDELMEGHTGVEAAVRIQRGFGNHWVEIDQNINIPVSGYFADPGVLALFQYDLEYGDRETALVQPFSVVLTKKAARKLFKQENPVGETLQVGENKLYKVTGVIRESDRRSHIAFDALASLSTVKGLESPVNQQFLEDWNQYTSGWVYVLMEDGKSEENLKSILTRIQQKHFATLSKPETQQKLKYDPQNLMRITPGPFYGNPIGPFLPWIFIYFFAGLGGVVMICSCFNFTNLSIARSLTRAREIGIRKVIGASRWQVFVQFLSESVLISFLAFVIALLLLILGKPMLMTLSFARLLHWNLEANYYVFGAFIIFALFTGACAGIFPAVVLSGFQPIKVLKRLTTLKLFSNVPLRKTLLVTQFAFSLVFILTVILAFKQLNLFMKADQGFTMERNVVVYLSGTPSEPLKTELLKYNNIESVSAASHLAAAGSTRGSAYKKSLDQNEWTSVSHYFVDEDYLKNLDLKLLAGRFYLPDRDSANNRFIVLNENALVALNLGTPTEAIGQEIIREYDSVRLQIIGVVKNYNHQILMQAIGPMALLYDKSEYQLLQVKYSGSYDGAAQSVEKAWTKVNPTFKPDYKDFSVEVHKLYDFLFGDLVSVLSLISTIAILISCLGLLGMATYTTETRLREISIRKVLGSSNGAVVYLLSKGFVAILLMSILIAVPAAYFLNSLWLEKIAYHVTINATVIITGVLVLIVFGTVTIGSQTWRAAFVKPVDNLKGD